MLLYEVVSELCKQILEVCCSELGNILVPNAFLTLILSRCSTLHSIFSAIDHVVLFLCCLFSSSMTCCSCSLHLTTFCLQYKPTVIACVCIHLACKWSNWEIPVSTDGKHWWEYVDNLVTLELLDGKWTFP